MDLIYYYVHQTCRHTGRTGLVLYVIDYSTLKYLLCLRVKYYLTHTYCILITSLPAIDWLWEIC